jgi:MFS superfamily sulfate permease-like transporter
MLAALVGLSKKETPPNTYARFRYRDLRRDPALIGVAFELGLVSDFIAKPVLTGFVFGLSLTIMLRQPPKLLGIHKGSGDFFDRLWHPLTSQNQIHLLTAAVGAIALAITFGLGSIVPRVPSALVVFVGGILSSRLLGLDGHGVEVVGTIQGGMPHDPVFPSAARPEWSELLSGAVGIVLILYTEALAAGRTLATKNKYDIDPNQELAALGTANIASDVLQGIVVGGGMSGTAANES